MFVVAFYDVPANRTERYRKLLARYLHWMQNSVFSGDLSESLSTRMRHELNQVLQGLIALLLSPPSTGWRPGVEIVEHGHSRDDHHKAVGIVRLYFDLR
jgi:CRISPR-associated protein Cas2